VGAMAGVLVGTDVGSDVGETVGSPGALVVGAFDSTGVPIFASS
jgi:hypothetical protein